MRHWISIGRRPMPAISKRSTSSITWTRCSNIRSQVSEPAVDATYDGQPSYVVSIMEFKDDKVARETQYFADAFPAPASRAQWVERMDA